MTGLPVACVAAQSEKIIVEALNRFLLQNVVHSMSTVQTADRIVIVKGRLHHRWHYTDPGHDKNRRNFYRGQMEKYHSTVTQST